MPRIGERRPPAAPATDTQWARRQAILKAATRLGRAQELDRISAQQIAAEAGVALRTLYRYYPSKYHVYAGVLTAQIDNIKPPPQRSAAAVGDVMAVACRKMLRHQHLARTMIVSTQAVRARSEPVGYRTMRDLILDVAGVEDPTPEQIRAARLVEQVTFGILTWAVGGELDADQAAADIQVACSRLLAGVID